MERWLPIATPVVLVAMLLTGLMLPLYSDEVGWRLQERAGLDGVDKLYSEQCGPNTLAVPPWFMMPVRWYSALFNSAWPTPFAVRLSGVAYALVWTVMLLALIRRLTADGQRRGQLTTLACGLMGLGVMPWLLVWSRPEQPIILSATAALLIATGPARGDRARLWAPVAILMLGIIALSYHFKALILIPLFLAAMIAAAPPRRAWPVQGLCMLALGAATMMGSHYWFARLACPSDPVMAAIYAGQSLGLSMLKDQSGALGWIMAPARLIANYKLPAYIANTAPDITPMSNWLLPHLVSKATQIAWTIALNLLWLFGFALMVWALVAALRRGRLRCPMLLAGLTLACMSAWCASQLVRNVYECSFMMPLLVLGMVLALSGPLSPGLAATLRRLALLIGLTLPISALAILGIYGPSLTATAGKAGYLPGQTYSVGLGEYAPLRQQILQAAAACGIMPERHPARLLIDDVTYFTFMAVPLPDHKNAVLEPRGQGSLSNPLAYLRQRGSSGMVLSCAALPDDLRRKAHAQGGICCIGPDQWGETAPVPTPAPARAGSQPTP